MAETRETFRVLIVEDSPVEAALAAQMLSGREGLWAVETVDRLAAALTHLTRDGADVVILDLNLPDSKGLDTVTAVRAHTPDVPIVVLTSTNDEATSLEILRRGAQDYIVKRGWGSAQLHRTLRYAIERQRAVLRSRAGEARLGVALRLGPLGVSRLGQGLQFVDVNDAVCRNLGYRPDELLARTLLQITHADHRVRDGHGLNEVLARGVPEYRAETRWLSHDNAAVAIRLWAWLVSEDGADLVLVSDKLTP